MKFYTKPKSPYNFDLVAALYSRFPTQCVDIYSEGEYKRLIRLKNKNHFVKVVSVGSVKKPKLEVEVIPRVGEEVARNTINWIVGANEDISNFYKIGLKDKKFAQIINDLYGLRAPKTPSVFEALIIAITEQQIALPVALAIRKRLIEKYGDSVEVEGKKYYAFPTPEQLSRARPSDIRALKFSTRKAEYIVNVSKMISSGKVNLEDMRGWNTDKILDTLTPIRGLGPWSVEYMMCRGMGRYDALPAADIGLRASVTKYLNKKERVSEEGVRKLLEPFGKYKGHAAFYLIYSYAFQKYPQERK